jgi:Tfp pilus assembly protein PilO
MKRKTLTVAASVVCGTALVLLGAWIFIIYKSYSYKSQIATVSQELKTKSSENVYLTSLKTTLREAKSEAESIDKRFVSEEEIPSFITMLEDEASDLGVKVNFGSINLEEGEILDGKLKLQISGSGTWENVMGFIVTLDSLPYASTIEEMRVYNPSAMSETGEITSEWKFNVNLVQGLGKKI